MAYSKCIYYNEEKESYSRISKK